MLITYNCITLTQQLFSFWQNENTFTILIYFNVAADMIRILHLTAFFKLYDMKKFYFFFYIVVLIIISYSCKILQIAQVL